MYKSFDLLKKLYFVRTGGSKEELLAANIIADECRSLGASVAIEEFKVDGYEIKNTSLTFNEPNISVECVGVGMSGSTPLEGLTGDFTYVTSVQDAEIQDIKGRFVLCTQS